MRKRFAHDELGEKECVDCGRKLKKRIEVERPEWEKCYRCFKGLPPKQQE
jgi:hypothetical protein